MVSLASSYRLVGYAVNKWPGTLREQRPGYRTNQGGEGGIILAQYACARHMCVGAVHVLLVDGHAWALVPRIKAGHSSSLCQSRHNGFSRVLSCRRRDLCVAKPSHPTAAS